jgi:hypothetical protein
MRKHQNIAQCKCMAQEHSSSPDKTENMFFIKKMEAEHFLEHALPNIFAASSVKCLGDFSSSKACDTKHQ